MNRIYKIIYSEAKNGYMVVSEFARRHGCSSDHRPVFFFMDWHDRRSGGAE